MKKMIDAKTLKIFRETWREEKKMIVTHVFPPIPVRDFDWCAFWDGEEESLHYGYGKTKEEAIEDLQRLDQERWEADHDEQP